MKLTFLIIAAALLGLLVVFTLFHWPGRIYLVIASLVFFVLGNITDYQRRAKRNDTLDDDFIDDV